MIAASAPAADRFGDLARSTGKDKEPRPREMNDDFADPFIDAAYRDVLGREGYDLSFNLDLPVVVGNDAHSIADLPPVGIVRIVLA